MELLHFVSGEKKSNLNDIDRGLHFRWVVIVILYVCMYVCMYVQGWAKDWPSHRDL
jgi:hypothetical protein